MPEQSHEVTSYRYEFRRVGSENVALVELESDGRLVCRVALIEGGDPLPAPQENVAGWVAVALRADQLRELIGMLRNEKPVFFTWSGDPGGIARITTKAEPIGEEERRAGLLSFLFG